MPEVYFIVLFMEYLKRQVWVKRLSKWGRKWRMRLFANDHDLALHILDQNNYSIQLDSKVWIVVQSDEFHHFCYTKGYEIFKPQNADQ